MTCACVVTGCGRLFLTRDELRDHYQVIHRPEPPLPFLCIYCTASFAEQAMLRYHLQSKHNKELLIDSLPIHCPQCPRKFANASSLTRHMKLHTTTAPIVLEDDENVIECAIPAAVVVPETLPALPPSKTPVMDAFCMCALHGWGVGLLDKQRLVFQVTDFASYMRAAYALSRTKKSPGDEAARIKTHRLWFSDVPPKNRRALPFVLTPWKKKVAKLAKILRRMRHWATLTPVAMVEAELLDEDLV